MLSFVLTKDNDTKIMTQSGLVMTNSDVIATILSGNLTTGAYAGGSMYCAELRAYPIDNPAQYQSYKFEIQSETEYSVNIGPMLMYLTSEALNPSTTSIQPIQFGLSAVLTYLKDGIVHTDNAVTCSGTRYAFAGALTDMERRQLAGIGLTDTSAVVLSRKPWRVSQEIIPVGGSVSAFQLPKWTNGEQTAAVQYTVPTAYLHSTSDPSFGMVRFAILNSLGAIETVYARTLESLSYKIERTAFDRHTSSSVSPDANGSVVSFRKGKLRQQLSMSSGFVTREWMEWWATEFACASKYWIYFDSQWIPCTIELSKSDVTIYDRSRSDAYHLDFIVTVGHTGTNLTLN